MSKRRTILPCAVAFMDAFADLDPDERRQTAGDVAAFLIAHREGVECLWGELLNLVGIEPTALTESTAATLVNLLNSHHVRPNTSKTAVQA
jgi:hypothetical protein